MGYWPILSLVTFLPLVGAALILLLARGSDAAVAATSRAQDRHDAIPRP